MIRFFSRGSLVAFASVLLIVLEVAFPSIKNLTRIGCSVLYAESIDVVYTWVDDSDINWQGLRQKHAREYQTVLGNLDANTKNRYRNRNELKYSLRSIHKFASFVNHIYIVTSGQKPVWIKDDPKITIIDHQSIFLNKSDLPTFNSQAIEANLHRIPNLSEKFIYFNDDFFLGRAVTPADFFSRNGKIRLYTSLDKVPTGPVVPGESAYESAWKNTNALLNTYFGKEKRYQVAHVPYALTKSLMQEVQMRFPDVFESVSSHKFRMPTDFTLTNGLVQYYALYTDRCKWDKTYISMVRLDLDNSKNAEQFEKVKKYAYRFFCIEDVLEEDSSAVDKALEEFLMSYFPEAAPWENIVPVMQPNVDSEVAVVPFEAIEQPELRGALHSRQVSDAVLQ